jgi:hypothetical protein
MGGGAIFEKIFSAVKDNAAKRGQPQIDVPVVQAESRAEVVGMYVIVRKTVHGQVSEQSLAEFDKALLNSAMDIGGKPNVQ